MKAVRWIAVVASSLFVAGCEGAAFNGSEAGSDAGSTGNVSGTPEATPGETDAEPTPPGEP